MVKQLIDGRTAGRGAAVLLGGQWIKYLIQMASLVILARILTPGDYGLLTMVTAIIGAAAVIGDFGLSLAAIRAPLLSQEQKSNLFWINTSIGFITGLVIVALAAPIANFYAEPRLLELTMVLAVVFPINGLAVQFRVELNRQSKFKWIAIADVSSQAVGFIVALVGSLLGWSYWALASQTIISAAAALLLLVLCSHWIPGRWRNSIQMRQLVTFGANTSAVQIVNYVSTNLDSVLIGRVLGAATLGLYNRAFQLVSLPIQQLAAPLTRVVLPYLSKMATHRELEKAATRIQMVLSYGLIGVLSFIASTSEALIAVVLGPEWSGAWNVLEILALGGLFQSLGYVYYWIFLSTAKTGLLFVSELSGRIVMAALMVVVVGYGPEWVAAAGTVGLCAIWLVGTVFTVPRVGISTRVLVIVAMRPVLMFGLAYGAVKVIRILIISYWNPSHVLSLLVLTAVWIMVVLSIAALWPKVRSDLRAILSLVQQVFARR